jgi:hypothetical protein
MASKRTSQSHDEDSTKDLHVPSTSSTTKRIKHCNPEQEIQQQNPLFPYVFVFHLIHACMYVPFLFDLT